MDPNLTFVILVGFVHVGILAYVVRKWYDLDTERPPVSDAIRCGECGEENALGYQFCRECATRLPREPVGSSQSGSPNGRKAT